MSSKRISASSLFPLVLVACVHLPAPARMPDGVVLPEWSEAREESRLDGRVVSVATVTLTRERVGPWPDGAIRIEQRMTVTTDASEPEVFGTRLRLDSQGLWLVEVFVPGGDGGVTGEPSRFDPPRLLLPADVAPGRSWSGTQRYRGNVTTRRCDVVASETCVGGFVVRCGQASVDPDSGARSDEAETYCPGMGPVRKELEFIERGRDQRMTRSMEFTSRRGDVLR